MNHFWGPLATCRLFQQRKHACDAFPSIAPLPSIYSQHTDDSNFFHGAVCIENPVMGYKKLDLDPENFGGGADNTLINLQLRSFREPPGTFQILFSAHTSSMRQVLWLRKSKKQGQRGLSNLPEALQEGPVRGYHRNKSCAVSICSQWLEFSEECSGFVYIRQKDIIFATLDIYCPGESKDLVVTNDSLVTVKCMRSWY